MMKLASVSGLMVAALALSGCEEGSTRRYVQSPDTVIAQPFDTGRERGVLEDGGAAIVYDPDGCQGWLIDDGIEGYSGRRFDPISGLPICDDRYPPGTVLGDFQYQAPILRDSVPRLHTE
jgi:hypothetical protein